jgi:hypothetical protein
MERWSRYDKRSDSVADPITGLESGTMFLRSDNLWLAGLCGARMGAAMMFMAYPAILPIVVREWGLSGTAAGALGDCGWVHLRRLSDLHCYLIGSGLCFD